MQFCDNYHMNCEVTVTISSSLSPSRHLCQIWRNGLKAFSYCTFTDIGRTSVWTDILMDGQFENITPLATAVTVAEACNSVCHKCLLSLWNNKISALVKTIYTNELYQSSFPNSQQESKWLYFPKMLKKNEWLECVGTVLDSLSIKNTLTGCREWGWTLHRG